MRRTPLFGFLSTLKLLQCLASLSGSIQTRALQPPITPTALDDPRSFCPQFFPTTHPSLLFSVFESSMASQPTGSPSFPNNLESITMEQIGVRADEPTGDTPNDCSNPDSSWAAPKFFSDLSAFSITHFASGRDNLQIVAGVTFDPVAHADDTSSWITWTNVSTMLQLFYPKDSVNPAGWPRGGSEFYAEPLDLSDARSVTFAYSVFFPSDFEWVKGGKLPGLYGGRTGCSGGDSALDCFSTRLMWRQGGAGELYLYAPKDRQVPSLCDTPPLTVCHQTYGFSIARGSFKFSAGSWTHVSQTVVLNTPGFPDGGFRLEVDGKVAIDLTEVFYRDSPSYMDRDTILGSHSNSESDRDGGSSESLQGGLSRSGLDRTQVSSTAQPDDGISDREPVGFKGIFFSTFFGGHQSDFATPKDQCVWFKDFSLRINDPVL